MTTTTTTKLFLRKKTFAKVCIIQNNILFVYYAKIFFGPHKDYTKAIKKNSILYGISIYDNSIWPLLLYNKFPKNSRYINA